MDRGLKIIGKSLKEESKLEKDMNIGEYRERS